MPRHHLCETRLKLELTRILKDQQVRSQMQKDYGELKTLLSVGGNASLNAARAVVELIS